MQTPAPCLLPTPHPHNTRIYIIPIIYSSHQPAGDPVPTSRGPGLRLAVWPLPVFLASSSLCARALQGTLEAQGHGPGQAGKSVKVRAAPITAQLPCESPRAQSFPSHRNGESWNPSPAPEELMFPSHSAASQARTLGWDCYLNCACCVCKDPFSRHGTRCLPVPFRAGSCPPPGWRPLPQAG